MRQHGLDRKSNRDHEQYRYNRPGNEKMPEAPTLEVTLQIFPFLNPDQTGERATQNSKKCNLGILLSHQTRNHSSITVKAYRKAWKLTVGGWPVNPLLTYI